MTGAVSGSRASWPLVGLFLLALGFTLSQARVVVLPFVLAILLSFILDPLVTRLARWRVPRWAGALLVILAGLSLLTVVATLLAEPVARWVDQAPEHLRRLEDRIGRILQPMERVGRVVEQVEGMAQRERGPVVQSEAGGLQRILLANAGALLLAAAIVIVLLGFLLTAGNRMPRRLMLFGRSFAQRHAIARATETVKHQVSRYLLTITLINTGLGIAIGSAMYLLGMPTPALWGVMAGLFNFVPYLGAMTGVAIVGLVAFLTFDQVIHAMAVPLAYGTLTALEGTVFTPIIVGYRLGLSPLVVLLSLLFWGWLWGVPGALLAVPITESFRIACERYPPLGPVALLLAREPRRRRSRRRKALAIG